MSARTVPESDEVAAHQYRLAQARRVIYFADEHHVSPDDAQELRPDMFRRECLGDSGQLRPSYSLGDEVFEQRVAELLARVSGIQIKPGEEVAP